jgi:hypothetical protein
MDSLIWLALAVIFVIIARICVTIITQSGSIPRRRGHTETCHLAVFLGSGKLDTIHIIHRPHAQIALLSRWSQQRGPVTGVCTRFLTLYPEDVSGKRGGLTQRTKGRHIGAAQNCLRSISRKCYLLLAMGYRLTATLPSDSTRKSLLANTKFLPFHAPGMYTRTSSQFRSRCYARY